METKNEGMNKFLKIASVQGGPFAINNSSRVIDYNIPSGVYDFQKSSVLLTCSIDNLNNIGVVGLENAIYRSGLMFNDVQNAEVGYFYSSVHPSDLVRDAELSCEKSGVIENNKRINFFNKNISSLMETEGNKFSSMYGLNQTRDINHNMSFSHFQNLVKVGATASSYENETIIRIPFRALFGCGQSVLGFTTNAHIRLNLEDKNWFKPTLDDVPESNTKEDFGNQNCNNMDFGNIYTLTRQYNSLEDSPFYVSQPLTVYALKVSTLPPPAPPAPPIPDENIQGVGIVQQIEYDETTGTLVLTLSYELPEEENFEYQDVRVEELLPNQGQFNINYAEIELCEVLNASLKSEIIEYWTLTTEEYSGSANLPILYHQFSLEPQTQTVFVMFNSHPNSLVSNNSFIDRYRMRLDNKDITSRDVYLYNGARDPLLETLKAQHDPLHLDLVNRSFINSGWDFSNFRMEINNRISDKLQTRSTEGDPELSTSITILCSPTPTMDNLVTEKLLDLNIWSKDDVVPIGSVILYKVVLRTTTL